MAQHTRSKILAMSGPFLCTEYPDDKYVHVAKFVNMWSCLAVSSVHLVNSCEWYIMVYIHEI